MMKGVHSESPISVRLTNYTKSGEKFVHQLSVEPLRDPAGETRCFQATSLVLQMPGCKLEEATPGLGRPSLISDHPTVPPLWPLLGHAMHRPEPLRAVPLPPPDGGDSSVGHTPPVPSVFDLPLEVSGHYDGANDIMKADDILSWCSPTPLPQPPATRAPTHHPLAQAPLPTPTTPANGATAVHPSPPPTPRSTHARIPRVRRLQSDDED